MFENNLDGDRNPVLDSSLGNDLRDWGIETITDEERFVRTRFGVVSGEVGEVWRWKWLKKWMN